MEVITAGIGKPKSKVSLTTTEFYEVQEDFCKKALNCSLLTDCENDRIKNDVIVCNALYLHCVERGFKPCQI